jgi:hypothetical protein
MPRIALCMLVTACGAFVEPVAPTPQVVAPPPTIIQNNITLVTAPPPVDPQDPQDAPAQSPTPPPPPAPAPRAERQAAQPVAPPPFCACWATATMPPERANRVSTTIASCDRYLDGAELSGRCTIAQSAAFDRMVESLDLTRRSWRKVAAVPGIGRDTLVESCNLSARQFAETMAENCHTH